MLSSNKHHEHPAFEYIVHANSAQVPLVLTCEHASQHLPEPWSWSSSDQRLPNSHWAFDLGAREITLELAQLFQTQAVLAKFTRLLIDPNRPLDSETLFRNVADQQPVALNLSMTESDRQTRISNYWEPYHLATHEMVATSQAPVVLSIHSFTPLYEGQPRHLEIGVLFDSQPDLANNLLRQLASDGFDCDLNEPYSGLGGFMYSAERCAQAHNRKAIELEVRNDLAMDPAFRQRLTSSLQSFFLG
jgi:predicted N-formylglutamate amidohydrolase